jgi:hypothetical protein
MKTQAEKMRALITLTVLISFPLTVYSAITELYYSNSYIFFPVTSNILNIQLKTSETAEIILTEIPYAHSIQKYEIQLGEIENGERVSRISANGQKKVEAVTPDVLAAPELDKFVIIWDYKSGYLVLGRKGDWLPLLQWRDTYMTAIAYYGIRIKSQKTSERDTTRNDAYTVYSSTEPQWMYNFPLPSPSTFPTTRSRSGYTSDENTGHWLIESAPRMDFAEALETNFYHANNSISVKPAVIKASSNVNCSHLEESREWRLLGDYILFPSTSNNIEVDAIAGGTLDVIMLSNSSMESLEYRVIVENRPDKFNSYVVRILKKGKQTEYVPLKIRFTSKRDQFSIIWHVTDAFHIVLAARLDDTGRFENLLAWTDASSDTPIIRYLGIYAPKPAFPRPVSTVDNTTTSSSFQLNSTASSEKLDNASEINSSSTPMDLLSTPAPFFQSNFLRIVKSGPNIPYNCEDFKSCTETK